MSQFLPETPQSAQQATDFKPVVETPTMDGDVALMQRIFSAAVQNPSQIPSDFLAYVVDYIQTQRLNVPIGQVTGYQNSVNDIVNTAVAQALAGQFKATGWVNGGFSMPNNTLVGPVTMPTISGLVSGGNYVLMGGADISTNSGGSLNFSTGLGVDLAGGGGSFAGAQVITGLSGTSITATAQATGGGAGGNVGSIWAWALRTA